MRRRHLGAISGLGTSLTVLASAVGPVLFAAGLDLFGSYRVPMWLCLALNAGLLGAAVVIPQREP
ncbi:MAG: hypothetical protein RIB46_05870 [Pseudomonadales bacterium]